MRKYKPVLLAAMMASVTAAAAGCSGGGGTSAPNVTLATVAAADHTVEDDGTEASVELLSLQSPIEFCYSYYNTDMLFVMEDGKWTDMMVPETPINQEMFNSMADKFLNLKAIEKVENPKTMEEYNMDYPAYSLYLTDGEKGAVEITIGDQDENGNYYATLDGENFYLLKKSTVESLIMEYDDLVVKDTLDLTVAPEDIKKASVTYKGKTTSYKSSDTEAMTRIADGLTRLKPDWFSDYYASASSLQGTELDEEGRITFTAELDMNGETQSVTVYIGIASDVEGLYHYVQLEGSDMICYVETEILDSLLNGNSALTEIV